MADKIVIELDLESGDVKKASDRLESAGAKAGTRAASSFKGRFNKGLGNIFGSIAKRAAVLTTAIGGVASALLGFQSIRAAQVQEDAVNSLNSALLISKNASIEASEGIQAFASELQQSTRFGDELLLQNAALIQSLGDLDQQGLQRATRAATDLATALRIDLSSAATLVGKAAAGEVGSFSRYGLIIKKGADNTETFARALDAIEDKFGGAAQRDVLTFSGSVDQLSNSFGDVLEEIGKIVTQNPKFVKGIQVATRQLVEIGSSISNFGNSFDFFDVIIRKTISLNDALVKFVIKPLEFVGNVGDLSLKILSSGITTTISAFAKLGSIISKVLSSVGIENEALDGINRFSEQAALASQVGAQKVRESLASIGNFPLSENLSQKNQELREFFQEQNTIAEEQTQVQDSIIQKQQEVALTFADTLRGVFSGLTSGVNIASDDIKGANEAITKFSQNSGKQLQQGFGKAAGSAFAEFGASLQQGNASLSSFTDALFKQLAQSAVTLGTNFILEGTAYLFSANPALQKLGPSLISSGAALAAFGGALGAASGGGGGASGGGASSGAQRAGGAVTTDEELASPVLQTQAEERTNLSLNIEGSLVRESELNGYISEILEEGSSRNATIIPSLRTS